MTLKKSVITDANVYELVKEHTSHIDKPCRILALTSKEVSKEIAVFTRPPSYLTFLFYKVPSRKVGWAL